MNSQLRRVSAAVYDRPWLTTPDVMSTIDEILQFHINGGRLSPEEIQARLEVAGAAAGPRRGARTMGAVGVIPVYGVLFPRANLMTDMSGGTSVAGIRDSFREAMADESIGSIILDVDSPGGSVDGVEELATEIRSARGQGKPIVAIANYGMASGAYYLGSQADELVASPSSRVGWIGTVMVHQEFSKMDEVLGVTTTIIRNPPGKFGGNEYEPLSDQARAEMQQTVDDYSDQFYAAVSKGRGVSVATVKSDFGLGGGMTAARAKAAGLVDRVESFDDTVRRLATGKGPVSRGTSAITGEPYRAPGLELPQGTVGAFDTTPLLEAAPDRTTEAAAALALARAKADRN